MEGAKAAAPATREATIASFILTMVLTFKMKNVRWPSSLVARIHPFAERSEHTCARASKDLHSTWRNRLFRLNLFSLVCAHNLTLKMKLAIAALLAGSAAAFAPSASKARSSALSMADFSNELGVVAPTGFFDPANLTNGLDQATFDQYRTAELKHGRVCMLAVIGYIVPEVYRFPGEIAPGLKFADVPNGVAAVDAIPFLGWAQIFFLIGAVDYYGVLGDFDAGKKPVGKKDIGELQLNELQNGRLAMLAFLELARHDSQNLVSPGFDGLDNLITGLPFLYN